MFNICVVGMPFVGKTTIVELICKMYDMISFSMSLELKKRNNNKKMKELGDYPKIILDNFIRDNKIHGRGFVVDYIKTSAGLFDVYEIFNKHELLLPIIIYVEDDNIYSLLKKAVKREIKNETIPYQNLHTNSDKGLSSQKLMNLEELAPGETKTDVNEIDDDELINNCMFIINNAYNRIKKYIYIQNDIDTSKIPWNNTITNDDNTKNTIIEQIEEITGTYINNINVNFTNFIKNEDKRENQIEGYGYSDCTDAIQIHASPKYSINTKSYFGGLIEKYFEERNYEYMEYINSIAENKRILRWISTLINIKKNDQLYFPGEMVYSMDNKSVENVILREYMVSLKLDGVRFLLCSDKTNIYFINRSFDIYKGAINKTYNHNVIFDGELIKCKYNKYWYIIFDVLYFDNMTLPMDVLEKLYMVKDIPFYNEEYVENDITIVKKMYYNKMETPKLIKFKSIYPGDGLIFTPINPSNPTYKWKKTHTFDFRLMKIKNNFKLYAYNGYREVEFVNCIINNNNMDLNKYVNKIVECYEYKNRGKNNKRIYEIKNIRTDKNRPNKIQVIANTTKLSECDLLKHFYSFRK